MNMTRTLPRGLPPARWRIRVRRWREGKVRPVPGNAPHEPAGKPGACFTSLKERLRRSLRRHSETATSKNTEELRLRFLRHDGIYRSDVVPVKTKTETRPWGGTVPPPAGRPRAQVKERVGRTTLFSSSAMSSGRLFLDRVGRHQSPPPLRRHAQITMHSSSAHRKPERSTLLESGTFYFALTRISLPGSGVLSLDQPTSSGGSETRGIRLISYRDLLMEAGNR